MSTKLPSSPHPAQERSRLQRWLYAVIGVLAVALGAIGAVVPGLPTTVFVLIASFCFSRSCPWLEERLLRNRLFARSMSYIDGERRLTQRERWTIAAVILLFSSFGAATLWAASSNVAVAIGVLAFGLVGVVFVMLWRRQPRIA